MFSPTVMLDLCVEATLLMRPVRITNPQFDELGRVWKFEVWIGPLRLHLSVPDDNLEGETDAGVIRLLHQYSRKAIQDGIVQMASAPIANSLGATNHNIGQLREDFEVTIAAKTAEIDQLRFRVEALERSHKRLGWFR